MITVPPEGNRSAKLVLIGEAPGKREMDAGRPFVGPSYNQRLKPWWASVGLDRSQFYIDNVCPYLPAAIDKVPEEEMLEHIRALKHRLDQLDGPTVIVPAGNYGLWALTGKGRVSWDYRDGKHTKPGITSHRGSIYGYTRAGRTTKVIPTIHPAATFVRGGKRSIAAQYVRACLHDWRRIAADSRFPELEIPERDHYIKPNLDDVLDFAAEVEGLGVGGGPLAVDIETPPTMVTMVELAEAKGRWVPKGSVPPDRCARYKTGTKKGRIKTKQQAAYAEIDCIGFAYCARWSLTIPLARSYWRTDDEHNQVWAAVARILAAPCAKLMQNGMYDCLPGDAEVLTPTGWVRLNRLPQTERKGGLRIAQWNQETGRLSWTRPNAVIKKPFSGNLHEIKTRALSLACTPTHRIPLTKTNGVKTENTAEHLHGKRVSIPTSGLLEWENGASIPWIELVVAIQADGYLEECGTVVFNLKKSRKIERLQSLCKVWGATIRELRRGKGQKSFAVSGPLVRMACGLLTTEKKWGSWLLGLDGPTRHTLLFMLRFWDGSRHGTATKYFTKSRKNAEWIVTLAHVSNAAATLHKTRTNNYVVTIRERLEHIVLPENWKRRKFSGKHVYCVSVDTSFFLVRYRGTISVTGNCYWLRTEANRVPTIRNWIWDTRWMHHALDPTDRHSLEYLVSVYTRTPYYKDEAKDPESIARYGHGDALHTYNGKDATETWAVWAALCREHARTGIESFYREHYGAMLEPLLVMGLHGICMDEDARRARLSQLSEQVQRATERMLEATGGQPLIADKGVAVSSDKLKKYLYDDLGLPPMIKRKAKAQGGGRSVTTDEVALKKLMMRYPGKAGPVCKAVLEHRAARKASEPLAEGKADTDGRMRCIYSMAPYSGRLASQETPRGTGRNLQNIPRGETRAVFVPDED